MNSEREELTPHEDIGYYGPHSRVATSQEAQIDLEEIANRVARGEPVNWDLIDYGNRFPNDMDKIAVLRQQLRSIQPKW